MMAGCLATQAMAQTAPSSAVTTPISAQGEAVATEKSSGLFSIDLSLGAVSDYRFRGISLSNKDPAFQPSVTVTHKSGAYASVWGSNIADNGGDVMISKSTLSEVIPGRPVPFRTGSTQPITFTREQVNSTMWSSLRLQEPIWDWRRSA